ncbi:Organic hydroperoxide resistance transcriptional regulator [Pontiella desulfatans]|uniref:Organic hydroperoxide resistance transcriptional regulator n=1 Tax=Pontiella desulfatans TaxID=2750659 RepID=A0A6C2TVA8_PONDE|nr:TolC family protein [Pontiella desulfatans]VGO11560.1 Organic hydroperoxide resistance transcriptional regulator [Pontiella desulfatans]
MKTISKEEFVDFMSEVLPELISSVMREDTSAVSKGAISVPQFWALHYINQHGHLTVNALAAALHRGKSTTSALLQRLEKSGLVKRRRSAEDQRIVQVSLTPKGKKLVDQLAANRKMGIRETYATLSAEERTQHMLMLRKIIQHARTAALAVALLIPSLSFPQTTNRYSLEASIQIGLKRSLTVANAARNREIAEMTRKRAISQAMPKLTGTANYTAFDPDNISGTESKGVGASANWEIFSGGRTLSAIRASKSYRRLTAYQERRVRATQARDITLAYYEVQLAKEQVSALEQSVEQLAGFENETRKKYDAGTVSEFDWLSAKVSLANEQPRLIVAENSLSLAIEGFRNLTFIDDEFFELTEPLTNVPVQVNLDQAIALGLRKRPELMEKASSVELRKEDINQQKSDYYPSLNLFANYDYTKPDPYSFFLGESGWQGHWYTGIGASWNLFDGGARKSNVAESKLNLAIEEDEYRDLERYVSLDVRSAWLRGRDAAEIIDASQETVGLATRALQISRSRFDAGLGTNLEVTQANVELSDARLARSQALYEYMVAVAQMKYAAGILLEEYE